MRIRKKTPSAEELKATSSSEPTEKPLPRWPILQVLVLFIASFFIAVWLSPDIWTNYWTNPKRSFDLDFYLGIAERGYAEVAWPAFYPAWPMILATCKWLFSLSDLLPFGHLLSFAIYAAATMVLYKFASQLTDQTCAAWLIALMTLNPNSIFHGIAYSESIFSLIATIFLVSFYRSLKSPTAINLSFLALAAAALAITRPILPQMLATGLVTAVILAFLPTTRTEFAIKKREFLGLMAIVICSGAVAYIPFGMVCYEKFGNFFQPYWAQSLWKRSPGFHWSLFLQPESVGGSHNILLWDLIAFYTPALLLAHLVFAQFQQRNRPQNIDLPKLATMLFSILFAGTHAAIAFLSYPIFMSLGRHVLATPFLFVGSLLMISIATRSSWGRKFLAGLTVISFFYLINFWTRFGRNAWIG